MKIKLGSSKKNIYNLLRKAGYYPEKRSSGKDRSFAKPLLGERYPRFHVYYDEEKNELNLHLDQKMPRYTGAPDHGAEYSGDLVEKEAKRLKDFLF